MYDLKCIPYMDISKSEEVLWNTKSYEHDK